MNGLLLFCVYMTVIYVPFDLFFKPVATDQEVWFGLMLSGWAAKLTEPLHWLIYWAGAVGFWKMSSWMHPWAALYTLQIALGMTVWSFLNGESAVLMASITAPPFAIIAALLWRARWRFQRVSDHA